MSPDDIVTYLRDQARRPLKARELAEALGVERAEYAGFRRLLRRMERDGALYGVKGQRYAAPERINLVTGRLQLIRSGAGFVVPEAEGEDLFVPADALGSAVDGDKVVARVEGRRRGGEDRARGRIIRVLERARRTVVGSYHPTRNFGFVRPEDPKLTRDVFVPPGQEAGAADGDVVVARITDWGDGRAGPVGAVERVLGRLGDAGVDVLAIIFAHELPLEFPPEVEAEAEQLHRQGITKSELSRRADLRDRLVFTIDPADARDHDDALSITRRPDGGREVGIHIADVSHYVTPGSALDGEAAVRGTSVYLVDRVVPMLPESLSADLCSLVPDRDRLALSLLLSLDDDGQVRSHRCVRSVIRCRHRLSYEEVQQVLDGGLAIVPELDAALREAASLARALRRRRQERGSLDFDLRESRVVLDEEGVPIDIEARSRLESHRLIEDFMLLANEQVARDAAAAGRPFIYRIHEPPDADRVVQLREFLGTFGLRLGGEPSPAAFQQVLTQVHGRPEEDLVSTVILRSMKQARYSAENRGHFGLAAGHYTHFTSPIRRYPDLVVHRLYAAGFVVRGAGAVATARGGGASATVGAPNGADLEATARHASQRERVAVEAERDSVDLKKVEFMQRHLGDEFAGTISGVTSFGFFVLLERYHVEGLVHVSSLEDDYYVFLEERYALVGQHTRRSFQIGEPVQVRVARVDLESRRIDFELLQPANGPRRAGRRSFDTR
jgi:ribonuclease R